MEKGKIDESYKLFQRNVNNEIELVELASSSSECEDSDKREISKEKKYNIIELSSDSELE